MSFSHTKHKPKRRPHSAHPQEKKSYVGTVDHVHARFAYIACEGLPVHPYVPTAQLHGAIHGDLVRVGKLRHLPRREHPNAQVIEILERKHEEWVGTLKKAEDYFVEADNRKLYLPIIIRKEHLHGAKPDDKVIVVLKPGHKANIHSLRGSVLEVLGPAGEHEAEINSIMKVFGLEKHFPAEVLAQAQAIPETIPDTEIKKRKDFRKTPTFTIDPEDAKDFDDALSLRPLDNDRFELGIHIADVTHYLKEDSPMDIEAAKRSTSIYLVDRTISMLPEKLSNNLCSLVPHKDRLAFSAVFTLDLTGQVHAEWFGRSIIHSQQRFTYAQAQTCLDDKNNPWHKALNTLHRLAQNLRQERFRNGAIDLQALELAFDLDEHGKPRGISPKKHYPTHQLIEECMLLANRRVAHFVSERKKQTHNKSFTFVYRTHDDPPEEKIATLALYAQKFGHKLDTRKEKIAHSLHALMKALHEKPEQYILNMLAIRSMAKAIYTTQAKPHFGLAFKHYTHFTSPIRRYADVMVHRLLDHYLKDQPPPPREPYTQQCLQTVEKEKAAVDAERASIRYKQVEYMSNFTGKTFDGMISGLSEWGMYVDIVDMYCEGMIRLSSLKDDYYTFDPHRLHVVGRNRHKVIAFGDRIRVLILSTDIERRTIDLAWINTSTPPPNKSKTAVKKRSSKTKRW